MFNIPSIEKGRKQDGDRSIADKIIKRLHDLEMTVESNKGRWAWELLQNAKDSLVNTDRKVSVELELDEESVVFKHNGTHFTEKDLRGLINQISSKEVEEGDESKTTGKFGTGFLSTHLLSKIIEVEGIVETEKDGFYKFSFPLDRNGTTTTQLIPKIQNAWTSFNKSIEDQKIEGYDVNEFNTSFSYNLDNDEQKDIARTGVEEFKNLIPFVLTFISEIESVNIIDKVNNSTTKFESSAELDDDSLVNVRKTENKNVSEIKILYTKGDGVGIASIVEETKDGYALKDLKDLPKIFCDFPLIGTENFHFPLIVNSFHFNPLTERDGIWLRGDGKEEVEQNRTMLKKAVELYADLLGKITKLNFCDYYNLCLTKTPNTDEKYFDAEWYKTTIQTPLREIILRSEVVEKSNGDKVPIVNGKAYVDFPADNKKSNRQQIWDLCNASTDYFILPKEEHIHIWYDLMWDDKYLCTEKNIAYFIDYKAGLKELQESLGDVKAIHWLDKVFEFILSQRENYNLFEEYSLIPNQEGVFMKRSELSKDNIEDEILKEIASLLGCNYYQKLIHQSIEFDTNHSTTTIEGVAKKITKLYEELVNTKLTEYSINSRLVVTDDNGVKTQVFQEDELFYEFTYDNETGTYHINSKNGKNYPVASKFVDSPKYDLKSVIRMLCEWFEDNPDKGKTHFKDLYRKKEKLFVDTIEDKASLYSVLRSKTPLSKIAELAKAMEDDPELLQLLEKRRKEKEEERFRNIMGEKIERLLAQSLQECGFKVRKEVTGKDLVISLEKSNSTYAIEVKSTSRASYVAMTPHQAEDAVKGADNYALCVVQLKNPEIDTEYVKTNAKFVLDIGHKLRSKVEEVIQFENNKLGIAKTNQDIELLYEGELKYKYKISNRIWSDGHDFNSFVEHIITLDG